MHTSSLLRMEWFKDNYLFVPTPTKLSLLDVGSFDVNGTYKSLFPEHEFAYTGLDLEAGANVDICPKNPYKWDEIESESFDVVISGQAFEHSEFFWLTMAEIARVVKPTGLVCLIAPRGFARHRFPVDCYRFDADGLVALARYAMLDILHASTNLAPVGARPEWYSESDADSMLIATKPQNWAGCLDASSAYTFKVPNLEALASGMIPQEQQRY